MADDNLRAELSARLSERNASYSQSFKYMRGLWQARRVLLQESPTREALAYALREVEGALEP